jgi:hypothetical protein
VQAELLQEEPVQSEPVQSESTQPTPEPEPEAVVDEQAGYKVVRTEPDDLVLAEEISLAVEGTEETEVEQPEESVAVSPVRSNQVQSDQVQSRASKRKLPRRNGKANLPRPLRPRLAGKWSQ